MNLKKSIEKLIGLDDKDYGKYHVSIDPIEGKITKDLREEIIENSLRCGYEEADKVLNKFNKRSENLDIFQLAKELGITIKIQEAQNALEYIYFGTYEEPAIVTLYSDNIRKGEELVAKHEIQDLQGVNLMEIILAHEIFHFIESKNKNLFINTFRIKLWKLGPYTHTSELICTGEIAGMAFTSFYIHSFE